MFYFLGEKESGKSKTMSPTGTRMETSRAFASRSNHSTPASFCPFVNLADFSDKDLMLAGGPVTPFFSE